MATAGPLRGSCSCGRNHYVILIPPNPSPTLQVLCDESADLTRPLTLRTPLTTISSTTHAFYPDETHSSIRRTFTPPHAPHTKRQFCGFCGTRLSYWSEESKEEAEYVKVDLGSLRSESLDVLIEVGLLEEGMAVELAERKGEGGEGEGGQGRETGQDGGGDEGKAVGREVRGNPWFEEVIEGSQMGRIRRRRVGETKSGDKGATTTYEWEVVEVGGEEEQGDGNGESAAPGGEKRKLGEGVEEEDSEMKG